MEIFGLRRFGNFSQCIITFDPYIYVEYRVAKIIWDKIEFFLSNLTMDGHPVSDNVQKTLYIVIS